MTNLMASIVWNKRSRRISCNRDTLRHIARDNCARADDGIIPDLNAGQYNRTAPDPHISSDPDRLSKLKPCFATVSIPWMICRQDLHIGTDLRHVADVHCADIQNDAAVIKEHIVAQMDVVSIVGVEGRSQRTSRSAPAEPFVQYDGACVLI